MKWSACYPSRWVLALRLRNCLWTLRNILLQLLHQPTCCLTSVVIHPVKFIMKSLFLLNFLFLGLQCGDPSTNGISENLPVKEGVDVVLHCNLGKRVNRIRSRQYFPSSGTPTERCIWRKNNRIVRLLPFKYELIGDISRGDCSIR